MWHINLSIFFMIFSFTLRRRKVKVSFMAELLFLMFYFYLWWTLDVRDVKYDGSFDFFFSSPSCLLHLGKSCVLVKLGFKRLVSSSSSSPLSILVCSLMAWMQLMSDISLTSVTGFFFLLILIFLTFSLLMSLTVLWVELNFYISSLLFLLHLFLCSFSRIIWRQEDTLCKNLVVYLFFQDYPVFPWISSLFSLVMCCFSSFIKDFSILNNLTLQALSCVSSASLISWSMSCM